MAMAMLAGTASAQQLGQLAISMTVQSSISLIFENTVNVGTAGNCALSNSGTNNVGLDLGTALFVYDSQPCVAFTWNFAQYTASSAFDVVVTKANSSSSNYRLAAPISTPPPAGVTWMVNNVTLNSASMTGLDASDAYATRVTKTLQVQVLQTVGGGTFSETITFLATAN